MQSPTPTLLSVAILLTTYFTAAVAGTIQAASSTPPISAITLSIWSHSSLYRLLLLSSSPDVLPLSCWLHLLYQYEMLCYDLGCIAIDDLHQQLQEYWEHV
ncbi:MAG: hypothetical protein [Microviridae sp.]|nr:MAG: hypothetical protein [Microviridae sp.]